jgi:SAM-dependent methyltransferase
VRASQPFEPRPEFERYAVEGLEGLRALAVGVVENLENLLTRTGQPPVPRIIDVGAGSGNTLKRLHERGLGSHYVAVDVQARLAEAVRRTLPDVPVEILVADTRSLPFDDAEFDLGLLSHVIEHVRDPLPVLRETARVSRLVYVEVPLEGNLLSRLVRALRSVGRSSLEEPGGHLHHLTRASLEQLVEEAELTILATRLYYPERLRRVNDASAAGRPAGRLKVWTRRLVSRTLGPSFVASHYNGFAGVLATLSTERRAGPGGNSASRS